MNAKYYVVLFLSIISYANHAISYNYPIIFVHLGDNIPSYSKYSLAQARLFNPNSDIYFIVNRGSIKSQEDIVLIEDNNIKIVYCEDLTPSEEHILFLKTNSLDDTYREGYWQKTSERFFVIEELISKLNLENVFHLENDVMLYVDLELLLPIFSKYKNIAAVFLNDSRVVPGFIYIKTAKSFKLWTRFLAELSKAGLTDMQVLSFYKQQYGSDALDCLPAVMPEYLEKYDFKSINGDVPKDPTVFTRYFNEFQSVFDGAALGQYLGGRDPILGSETFGFINKGCIFNSSYFTYKWVRDEKNRNIPYIVFGNNQYKINNLHVHSKRLELFKS